VTVTERVTPSAVIVEVSSAGDVHEAIPEPASAQVNTPEVVVWPISTVPGAAGATTVGDETSIGTVAEPEGPSLPWNAKSTRS
jgi:hypothetical protein